MADMKRRVIYMGDGEWAHVLAVAAIGGITASELVRRSVVIGTTPRIDEFPIASVGPEPDTNFIRPTSNTASGAGRTAVETTVRDPYQEFHPAPKKGAKS
jgi:hypothetical protein